MHECIPYEHPNKHPCKQQFVIVLTKAEMDDKNHAGILTI